MIDTVSLSTPVTTADVRAAQARIAPYVRHTPLEHSPALSRALGVPVVETVAHKGRGIDDVRELLDHGLGLVIEEDQDGPPVWRAAHGVLAAG